jgi:hypothetical protein
LLKPCFYEGDNLLLFILPLEIDLREENNELRSMAVQGLEQCYIMGREWLIDAYGDNCNRDMWKPFCGNDGVVREKAIETGCINEPNSGKVDERRQFNTHSGHLPHVAGVLFFRDERAEFAKGQLLFAATKIRSDNSFVLAVVNLSYDIRDRHYPHG